MTTAFTSSHPPVHPLSHTVAVGRLQARRRDDQAAQVTCDLSLPAPADFADTVPLWFRSEAFAEDVTDHEGVAGAKGEGPRNGSRLFTDSHVLAAGAAVLRQTVQALKLQRW